MRTLLLITIFTLNLTFIYGQTTDEGEYKFAKEVFQSEKYKKSDYPKFKKNIELIDNNTYKFGNKTIIITIENNQYLEFFKQGIFNPNTIFGKTTTKFDKAKFDTLPETQKILYNLTRNDRLKICCFEELEKLNPNPQTKRFRFWLIRIGVANPTEYYIEFHNQNATKKTSIEKFIENSKMTFYHKGTIII